MTYSDMIELGYTDKELLPKAAKEVKKSNSTKKAEKKKEE